MLGLEEKTAIVTGGASGNGRGISIELAKAGADVAIGDIREEPKLEKHTSTTTEAVRSEGQDAIFCETDVSKEEDAKTLIETTVEELGEPNILVNNAGIFPSGAIDEISTEDWDRTFDVNLNGIYYCSKYTIPYLRKQDHARIINLSSQLGLVGLAESSAYCASKGGIANLTRQMAIDYADDRITINAINPGVIKTSMTKPQLDDPEMRADIEANTLLPYLGEPEDVGQAAVFLASEWANFVTGHCLVVDGGWTAH